MDTTGTLAYTVTLSRAELLAALKVAYPADTVLAGLSADGLQVAVDPSTFSLSLYGRQSVPADGG